MRKLNNLDRLAVTCIFLGMVCCFTAFTSGAQPVPDFVRSNEFEGYAELLLTITPDNAGQAIMDDIDAAKSEIMIAAYGLSSDTVMEQLLKALNERNVAVTVLLEGTPFRPIIDQQKMVCRKLSDAGARIYHQYSPSYYSSHMFYNYMHAKYMIIDDELVWVGSENFTKVALSVEKEGFDTFGNRGTFLRTDMPETVEFFKKLFYYDLTPSPQHDVIMWKDTLPEAQLDWDLFEIDDDPVGTGYIKIFPEPCYITEKICCQILVAPWIPLQASRGVEKLLENAGEGDSIYIQQAYERLSWYEDYFDFDYYLNPRLELSRCAAENGAEVKIILSSYYSRPDDERGNHAVLRWVEKQNIENMKLRLSNPAGSGVHNKMILVRKNGRCWIHIGSLNGSSNSFFNNRETVLQIDSERAFQYYKDMFLTDWHNAGVMPSRSPEIVKAELVDLPERKNRLGVLIHWKPYYDADHLRLERRTDDSQEYKVIDYYVSLRETSALDRFIPQKSVLYYRIRPVKSGFPAEIASNVVKIEIP